MDPETFSGASRALLNGLEQRGALVAAVDGRPRLLTRIEQLGSFDLDRERWSQWHNAGASRFGPAVRWGMSAISGRRVAPHIPAADALLTITGWFAPRVRTEAPVLRCSYHDGNIALFLRRPDLRIDPGCDRVRRARSFEHRLHEGTDVVLTMSDWLRRSFIEDFGLAEERVVTVGGGANIAVPPGAPQRDFDRPRILFAGKQFERKGGPELVRAFAAVRARRPDAELWIVGPQHLTIDAPGVRVFGRVGRTSADGGIDMPTLYSQATALAVPARYDPFPTVFREAMAYRLPCVGTSVCSIPEMVLDGVTGHVVSPGDDQALAERLIDLVQHPDRAQGFGEAGFERYCERYTWEGVTSRVLSAVAAALP